MDTAFDVAAYIEQKKGTFGATQLQKLVYYSQAWTMVWSGRPLFDEEIEAWKNGPVVRSVYAAAKGGTTRTREFELSENAKAIVDAVYDFYGDHGGASLSLRTHREEPWIEARGDLGDDDRSTEAISQATMRRFYSKSALKKERHPQRPLLAVSTAENERVTELTFSHTNRWSKALERLAEL